MVITTRGQLFQYHGKNYRAGDRVRSLERDDYAGLVGVITEIRDGDDKEADNDTPDIHCCFEEPTEPDTIKELEERFSDLYGMPKTISDISMDLVIMVPDYLEVLSDDTTTAHAETNSSGLIKKMIFLKWKFARNLEILNFLDDENPIKLDQDGDCDYDDCRDKWWPIEDMEIAINRWPRLFLGVIEGKDDDAIMAAAKERFGFPVEALESESI